MKLIITLIFVSLIQTVFAKDYYPSCDQGARVDHKYYSLCYSENHELSSWTAHHLSIKSMSGVQQRTDNFRIDPKVITGSASTEDYKRSGFDRGHMVPASDMKLNYQSMSDTFFMSNMAPQRAGFNRGIWRRIENLTRKWSQKYNGVFVITGAVLEKGLPTIGKNSNVSIPRYFYKIIYDQSSKQQKMLAFLIENKSSKEDLANFVVTVDEIERLTGIDFFEKMNSKLQNKLESYTNTKEWNRL